jgi:hypothetical protein
MIPQEKRLLFAWLLLAIVSLHSIGGFVYFEVSYLVEVQSEMNNAERAIAKKLKEEMGVVGDIRFLHESSPKETHAYSSSLSFSTEINDETVYFAIKYDTLTAAKRIKVICHHPSPDEPSKMALLKNFFSEFLVPQQEVRIAQVPVFGASTFHYLASFSTGHSSVPAPPPDLA